MAAVGSKLVSFLALAACAVASDSADVRQQPAPPPGMAWGTAAPPAPIATPVAPVPAQPASAAAAVGAQPALRGQAQAVPTQAQAVPTQPHNFAAANKTSTKQPCQCVAADPSWKLSARTVPKCIFIDLGAANGNTYQKFMSNGYGPVANCPSGDYEAWLVEANPRFEADLKTIEQQAAGKVHAMYSTAAYDCEAQTSFYLDTTSVAQNYWGSSMSDTHPDTQKSGLQKVTVPTLNVNRLIYENTIPGDWVLLKVDIEGSEWDVVPCLAKSGAKANVDRMLLEEHPMDWQLGATTRPEMDQALNELRAAKVDIPQYFSETL